MKIKILGLLTLLLFSLLAPAGCGGVDPDIAAKLKGDWTDSTGLAIFIDVDKNVMVIKPADVVDFKLRKAVKDKIEIEFVRGNQKAGMVCAFETEDLLVCQDIGYKGPDMRWHRGAGFPTPAEAAASGRGARPGTTPEAEEAAEASVSQAASD